jgi:hypothetical protein
MNFLILATALALQGSPFPDADPKPAIEAARKKAAAENRRVLVLWGANAAEESKMAAALLKSDKGLKKLILYEYDLVLADERRSESGLAIIPYVVILDADGKVLSESPAPTDVNEWTKLLEKQKSTPLVAKEVLAAGLKKAKAEKKRVLLTFGAPW